MKHLKGQREKIISSVVILAAGVVMLSCVLYFSRISEFFKSLLTVATPLLVGLAVAFLLTPLLRRIEALLRRFVFRKKPFPRLTRAIGIVLCYAVLLAFLYGFASILIPQLISSIRSILVFVGDFLYKNRDGISALLQRFEFLKMQGEELIIAWENISSQVTSLLNYSSVVISNVFSVSKSIYTGVFNAFVGIVSSAYMLVYKDRFAAQGKKACYALFRKRTSEILIYWFRRASHVFAGFISGKIIDSLIIGVLCYLGMLVFRMEFPVLISVIVGVTNIIPFFGPFIGAVPSILILLIVNPVNALWFALFILVLQQLDGNIIGPFILGDSVGISPFWIMVSIVLGGGLFGFVGMLLSVPIFALVYAMLSAYLEWRLKRKEMPFATVDYENAPECFAGADVKEAAREGAQEEKSPSAKEN